MLRNSPTNAISNASQTFPTNDRRKRTFVLQKLSNSFGGRKSSEIDKLNQVISIKSYDRGLHLTHSSNKLYAFLSHILFIECNLIMFS